VLDHLVLRPSRHEIPIATQQRVMLDASTGKIECLVHRSTAKPDSSPTSKNLVVLKFPGTAGRAERSSRFPADMLTAVSSQPVVADVWTWNPPGYGRSEGRATLASVMTASIDFWQQVTRQYPDPATRVWLCGNSLGCVTALHVAATIQPDTNRTGVILRNPPPLIPVVKRIAHRYPLGRLIDPVAETLDPRMNATVTAGQVNLPAVFLQSELDSLVPPRMQQNIVDAYAGQKRVVTLGGLEHDCLHDETHESEIRDALLWLWNTSEVTGRVRS
tara:strand:+ start:11634 stop:12455 length:822 start_codon:yes stop_codon:yes gene_type:complete